MPLLPTDRPHKKEKYENSQGLRFRICGQYLDKRVEELLARLRVRHLATVRRARLVIATPFSEFCFPTEMLHLPKFPRRGFLTEREILRP